MNFARRQSDRQIVNTCRRMMRWRRPAAAICLLAAAAMIATALYFDARLTDMLQAIDAEPTPPSRQTTDYWMGYITGAVIFGAIAYATSLLATGISLFFPDHRTRLLIKYHDRCAAAGLADQSTEESQPHDSNNILARRAAQLNSDLNP